MNIFGICTRIYVLKCSDFSYFFPILACERQYFRSSVAENMQNSFLNATNNFLTFLLLSRSISKGPQNLCRKFNKVETIMKWNETKSEGKEWKRAFLCQINLILSSRLGFLWGWEKVSSGSEKHMKTTTNTRHPNNNEFLVSRVSCTI